MSISLSDLNPSKSDSPRRKKKKSVVNLAAEYSRIESRASNKNTKIFKVDEIKKEFVEKEVIVRSSSLKEDYERKIADLELSLSQVVQKSKPLSVNETKLLNAIKSEIINQGKKDPIIGRSMLIKKFKMNSKYLDIAISSLEKRLLIKRTQVPYTENIMTNSWKLI